MGARWYTPATGTFASRDTYGGELSNPISLNRYTYANGNPLSYFDPDGHKGLSLSSVWNATSGAVSSGLNAGYSLTKDVVSNAIAATTTSSVRAVARNITAAQNTAIQMVSSTAGALRSAARVTSAAASAAGTYVVQHREDIVRGAAIAGGVACLVVSAGACGVVGVALFAGFTASSAIDHNIIGGNGPADWRGFALDTAVNAALTWGPGALLRGAKAMGMGARVATGISTARGAISDAMMSGRGLLADAAAGARGLVQSRMASMSEAGMINFSEFGRIPAKSAIEAADKALASGRTGGAAAELRIADKTFTDISTGGVERTLNAQVQAALDSVPSGARPRWHGNCAELGCISQALDAGVDPAGGVSEAVNIGESGDGHGTPKAACSSCRVVLRQFGVSHVH